MPLRKNPTQLGLDRPGANGDGNLVSGTRTRYRREFTDPTLSAWDVSTGPGMAIAVANSNMTITTGTTANSETRLTTKETFSAPFRAQFGLKLSQKLANQEFYAEIIAVDGAGIVDETVVAAWRLAGTDSTTTTVARTEVRNGQAARSQSGNQTTASQTTDGIFEIVLESDEVSFHNKAADSIAGKTLSSVRNTIAPDPNLMYKLRLRAVNASVAPASTTTLTASFVTALDYTETLVEVTGGQGRSDGSGAIAVTVTGGTVGMTSTALAPSATAGGTNAYKTTAAASTNAANIKTTAARVYGYRYTNTSAATKFVRLYNKATAPTVGTDSPIMVIPVPAGQSVATEFAYPVAFASGLGISVTGAAADLDATAVAVNDVIGHLLWI